MPRKVPLMSDTFGATLGSRCGLPKRRPGGRGAGRWEISRRWGSRPKRRRRCATFLGRPRGGDSGLSGPDAATERPVWGTERAGGSPPDAEEVAPKGVANVRHLWGSLRFDPGKRNGERGAAKGRSGARSRPVGAFQMPEKSPQKASPRKVSPTCDTSGAGWGTIRCSSRRPREPPLECSGRPGLPAQRGTRGETLSLPGGSGGGGAPGTPRTHHKNPQCTAHLAPYGH